MTHEERLNLAVEFNKKFIANNYVSKTNAEEILVKADLTEEEITVLQGLYPEWHTKDSFKVGEYIRYNDTLYKVIQAHSRQDDWMPDITASLFTIVQAQGIIEDWGERNLTTNPFMIGEQVKYNSLIYESIIDNNVWTPVDYPQGWRIV